MYCTLKVLDQGTFTVQAVASMTTQAQHLIAGRFVAGKSGSYFQATNPSTGDTLPTQYPEATHQEVDEALVAASSAFVDFRRRSGSERSVFLEAIAQELEALGDDLVNTAQCETALPLARLTGERARTLKQIRLFAAMAKNGSWVAARIDAGDPGRKPLPKPDVRALLVPVGPVVVFGASNFPLAISVAGTDTVSALAAGCPVVVKAHPSHPGTSQLVAAAVSKAVARTQMPPGVFSMLHGAGHDVGLALARHPATAAVAFTGSHRGGRALFDAANARPSPIPVYAEMGSVNPVFVLPQALAERGPQIAFAYVQSLSMGVGQFCTNPGQLFVCEGQGLEAFLTALGNAVAAVPPASMLNASILRAFDEGVSASRQAQGVEVLAVSSATADKGLTQAECTVFSATAEAFAANPFLSHEVFGPTSVVVRCKGEAQMLEFAHNLDGQLTASVHANTGDLAAFPDLVPALEQKVGRLVFDGFATGIEVCSAMHHSGPYPATTSAQFTSIGHASIYRFVRPVAYQNTPQSVLPLELQDGNPLGIWRLVNGQLISPL